MINGTGMIETDKLILEIANKTALKNNFLLAFIILYEIKKLD